MKAGSLEWFPRWSVRGVTKAKDLHWTCLQAGRTSSFNIPSTFVLTKCLLIKVESPAGFALVNWRA